MFPSSYESSPFSVYWRLALNNPSTSSKPLDYIDLLTLILVDLGRPWKRLVKSMSSAFIISKLRFSCEDCWEGQSHSSKEISSCIFAHKNQRLRNLVKFTSNFEWRSLAYCCNKTSLSVWAVYDSACLQQVLKHQFLLDLSLSQTL